MSERKSDLKPCPFCGGSVKWVDLYDHPGMRPSTVKMVIVCENCGLQADFGGRAMFNQKQLWNKREGDK